MKKRLVKILFLLLFLSLAFGMNRGLKLGFSTVRAVGDLSVDWGVPEGSPIFNLTDFSPGNGEARTVRIINNSASVRPVGVRGIKTNETGNLSARLLLRISDGAGDLYGGSLGTKTLAQFFTESAAPEGVFLKNYAPNSDSGLTFTVDFDPSAQNEFQNTSLTFDLRIGISFEVPIECQGIIFSAEPIYGTEGIDSLKGTNGNDLIIAFEGNDKITGGNGRDCLIGGAGNDSLDGGNESDILLGGDGNDELNGSNDGDGLFGQAGKDSLDGGNGNDMLFGNENDDTLKGGNGDDRLDGGPGSDNVDGGNGRDACIGEAKKACET